MLSKSMIFQLLEGLKHIHSLNVIHRNLKPSVSVYLLSCMTASLNKTT